MASNAYPDKPIVKYVKTTVPMPDVIKYLAELSLPVELKRSAYVFFRNESSNGTRGINNNYCGIQADSGRWPAEYDEKIIGTVVLKENQTNRERRFVAFKDFKTSVDFLVGRLKARGLFVGGYAHKIAKMQVTSPADLARVYQKEWVKGSQSAEPTPPEKNNFLSMYNQAQLYFPKV